MPKFSPLHSLSITCLAFAFSKPLLLLRISFLGLEGTMGTKRVELTFAAVDEDGVMV
jgi:hypothetical protein